jgi:hypothetical protein
METVVRVRCIMSGGGKPSLTFAVDGHPAFDQPFAPNLPPMDAFSVFQSTPQQNSTVIQAAGDAILTALFTHANGKVAIANTLNAPVNDRAREIRIHIENIAKIAHNLPWEAIHDPLDGFIALSRGVPFRRVVPAVRPDVVRRVDTFNGTLKIAAVIAAGGIPGDPQWLALRAALDTWQGAKQCMVLVGTTVLRDTISALALPNVQVELVPLVGDDLVQSVGNFAPHILHVFCHGQSEAGGVLEIATPNTEFGGSPLFIRPTQLATALRSTWVVVLNACSTGQVNPSVNSNSFACNLIEQGVPFVAGMLQEVPAGVAHRFAETFLSRLVGDLSQQFPQNARFPLQVAPAVMAARASIMALYGGNPGLEGRIKEWTLPILCSSVESFEIHPTDLGQQQGAETLAQIRLLKNALASGIFTVAESQRIQAEIDRLTGLL